jgi:hypothetical protein
MRYILALLSCIAIATIVNAQTNVSGFINANTTWALTSSPYIVVGNTIVQHGVTLTIDPGVIVKFDSAKVLQIDGELIARGTSARRIVFTSNRTSPAAGDWGKIQFADTSVDAVYDSNGNYVGGSFMSYCDILYGGGIGYGAIQIVLSSPYLTNCHIAYSLNDGIYCSKSSFLLDSSAIVNCTGWGLEFSEPPFYSNIIIYADTISFNSKGGAGIIPSNHDQSNINITHNLFEANLLNGAINEVSNSDSIYMSENIFLNNSSTGNASTVYFVCQFFIIECNKFINNLSGTLGTLGFVNEAPAGNYIRNNLFQGNNSSSGCAAINFNISHSIYPSHDVNIINNNFINNTSTTNSIVRVNAWFCPDTSYVDFYFNNNNFSSNSAPSILKFEAQTQIAAANFIHLKNNNLIDPLALIEINNFIPYSAPNIEADSNYWGTTNSQHIDSVIRDFFDNGNLSVVFCSAPLSSPISADTICPPPITTNNQSALINQQSINLFPNPFTTQSTLSFTHDLHNATLHIYNMYGQVVQQLSQINGKEIVIERKELANGIYIYAVEENNQRIATGKAVIY